MSTDTPLPGDLGYETAPIWWLSVVVAYLATEALAAYVDSRVAPQAADTVVTERPAPATF